LYFIINIFAFKLKPGGINSDLRRIQDWDSWKLQLSSGSMLVSLVGTDEKFMTPRAGISKHQ
jgi:hypothetical protein